MKDLSTLDRYRKAVSTFMKHTHKKKNGGKGIENVTSINSRRI